MPSDFRFIDTDGNVRTLAEFRGNPVLVNFIYTGCFEVCPTSSRALRKAVLGMRDRFGDRQFHVLSIGFNQPSDSPVAMREFAARQRIDDRNWSFLAPAQADVAALADAFGFRFAATPMGFDHTLQVSILDAEGRLHSQVYGDAFAADALGEPLKQLLGGELVGNTRSLGDLIDRVRILCSVYDPVTGKYRTDWGLYLEIAGGLTFILTMVFLAAQEWWRHRRRGGCRVQG
ncbi:MAG: SCO family protein [Ahniella sp.]|nr:SCO family protein [Ahniella sp.]